MPWFFSVGILLIVDGKPAIYYCAYLVGVLLLFGRGCEAEASKPVPIFKGHFGRKGTHYEGFFLKSDPSLRVILQKGYPLLGIFPKK